MYCPACGVESTQEAKFCAVCGVRLPQTNVTGRALSVQRGEEPAESTDVADYKAAGIKEESASSGGTAAPMEREPGGSLTGHRVAGTSDFLKFFSGCLLAVIFIVVVAVYGISRLFQSSDVAQQSADEGQAAATTAPTREESTMAPAPAPSLHLVRGLVLPLDEGSVYTVTRERYCYTSEDAAKASVDARSKNDQEGWAQNAGANGIDVKPDTKVRILSVPVSFGTTPYQVRVLDDNLGNPACWFEDNSDKILK